ncbi:MAG TPA: AAA family ATPase [Bryobacteraceae bacterium]|nr:AAA family ATPase [Bryobacteraceae bacterium]
MDVPHGLLVDLVLRRTFTAGQTTLQDLSQALKLSPLVIEAIFRELRQQQLIEVKGMVGNDYSFVLTQAGRSLASERYQICHYAGPCPVSIKQYHKATKMQAAKVRVDRRSLRQALSDLVLPDRLLDQLGPAIISQSSIFLYGPTGSGKTSLAERLLRVYQDAILVPYAVEVDGQIIQLYDPVVHEAIETTDQEFDPRWVLCRRPCVITGGELAPSMLELRLDESSGIYAAPLQMKANNGVLVIDDFGRQLMSPRELLNRWIVPLDRRVDYLALRYGVKFQIPFEMLVVFATNLDPRELADEAFLRRLHNKVYVEAVEPQLFDEIFRRVATARNIPFEPDSADYLRKLCFREGGMELRACYPADICDILVAIANYEGRPVRMTKADLERAVALYFAQT